MPLSVKVVLICLAALFVMAVAAATQEGSQRVAQPG